MCITLERLRELESLLERILDEIRLLEKCASGEALAPRPGERRRSLKVGKRVVAKIFEGDGYVRAAAAVPLRLMPEARLYLEDVAKSVGGELRILEAPNGELLEVILGHNGDPLGAVKARAALRHALEWSYTYTRALERGGGDGAPGEVREDPR